MSAFRRRLSILLIAYAVLAVLYSVVTPIFEAPDENYHFGMIQHIAETGQLPVQDMQHRTPWMQEGSQPPLYYLLSAPLAAVIPDALNVPYPLDRNPHAQIGIGLARINRNVFIHTRAESFPWRGVPLAVHLIRLLSVAFGAWTIFCIAQTAHFVLLNNTLALIAAAFVAFNPMFLFIHASINNDTLVTALSATALWLIMRLILSPPAQHRRREIVLLSVVLALSALSKLSGLTLYGIAGTALLIRLIKRQSTLRQTLVDGVIITIGFSVIAAWWYVRNLQLYSDLTGLGVMMQLVDPRTAPYTLQTMLAEMQGLRISSWGLFGWLNVITPDAFLVLMDVLTALALIGGVIGTVRVIRAKRWDRLLAFGILGVLLLIVTVSLINWTRLTPGTQGRLLFPALPALAILSAFGWGNVRPLFAKLAIVPLIFMAGLAPLTIISRAYMSPPMIAAVPNEAHKIAVHFDQITVRGYKVGSAAPGDALPVTLYYQGTPDPRNLSLFLTAYDCHKNVIGKLDSYPGGGNLPTSQWQTDALYADSYAIPIAAHAAMQTLQTPCQPYIEFGWWEFASKTYLREATSGAQSVTVRGGALVDPLDSAAQPAIRQMAQFGGAIRLNGYTLDTNTLKAGSTLHLTLNWEALTTINEDFTVFVHLERSDHVLIGQSDAPPLNNDYPTSVWAIGRAFNDPHDIPLKADAPAGTYQIAIGLYRADDSRLSVSAGGDTLILSTPIVVQ